MIWSQPLLGDVRWKRRFAVLTTSLTHHESHLVVWLQRYWCLEEYYSYTGIQGYGSWITLRRTLENPPAGEWP